MSSTTTTLLPPTLPPTFSVLQELDLPPEFTEISNSSKYCVLAYSILLVLSIIGNSYVFWSVTKQLRILRTRTNLLVLNLCVADLIVTLFLMPMEIVWRITIQWEGGDLLCKLCQFFRAFGLYSSSLVVICISVDRFFALVYPLKYVGATRRVRIMLWGAWIVAGISALPQMLVFQVTTHPKYPSFSQCVSRSFLRGGADHDEEFMYNMFSISILYVIPLLAIIFTYSMILCNIHQKSQSSSLPYVNPSNTANKDSRPLSLPIASSSGGGGGHHSPIFSPPSSPFSGLKLKIQKFLMGKCPRNVPTGPTPDPPCGSGCPRGSSASMAGVVVQKMKFWNRSLDVNCNANGASGSGSDLKLELKGSGGSCTSLKKRAERMARARVRTLQLTLRILITFIVCWTPYVIMTLWYMIDRTGASKVDPCLQEVLFVMAVANSVLNPLIYGTHARGANFRSSANSKGRLSATRTQFGTTVTSPNARPKFNKLTTLNETKASNAQLAIPIDV